MIGLPSVASTNLLLPKMLSESGFASKIFPAERQQKLPLQFGSGDERFWSRRYDQSSVAEATS